MATSTEILNHIVAKYKATHHSGNVGFSIQYPQDDGDTCLIIGAVGDKELQICCTFVGVDEIDAHAAIELVAANASFGIYLVEDQYALSNLLWIENIDENEIKETIEGMVETFKVLKKALAPGA